MKTWYFDIKLGNGHVVSIDAKTFEQAFAILKCDHRLVNGAWSLVKFEDKIPEPDPTTEEIKKQSEELWAKLDWKKLEEARNTLTEGYKAFKAAWEFDDKHPSVCDINPMAHSNDKYALKHAETCIDELHCWIDL